jgi:hypothetical protein
MPGLRARMFEKLEKVVEDYDEMKGKEGQVIGDKIRLRLIAKKRHDEEKEQRDIDEMIQLTAQRSAL